MNGPIRRVLTRRLIRRIEEASMNAWPALQQLLLDGWLIRLSNGFTKRANCVVPLYRGLEEGDSDNELVKIRYCENLYAREQLQTIFRLTSHSPVNALDALLDERGYDLIDETQVQLLNLSTLPTLPTLREIDLPSSSQPQKHQGELRLVPAPQWLREYGRLAELPRTTSELHASLIRSIRPDCAFAWLVIDDKPVACALGVLEHDLFGLFDVITAPEHRRQGYAGALLKKLLAWGAEQGAQHAYLQVIADNNPALALYQQLGFEHLYSYWYRRSK